MSTLFRDTPELLDSMNPFAIAHIEVHDLFGYLSYSVPSLGDPQADMRRLGILYGDNGCGKTTILRMLYNLLSPRREAGHKTALASFKFRDFVVTLGDNSRVSATRKHADDTQYTARLELPTGRTASFEWTDGTRTDELHYLEFCEALSEVASSWYILHDDRTITAQPNDAGGQPGTSAWIRHFESSLLNVPSLHHRDRRTPDIRSDTITSALDVALEQLKYWLQLRATILTRSGDASTHTIYSDIIHRIATAPVTSASRANSIHDLELRLRLLSDANDRFRAYGLTSPLTAQQLIAILASAPSNSHTIIMSVLTPYLDGIEARLKALSGLYDTVNTLVEHLNHFLWPKVVTFSLAEGLTIRDPRGALLGTQMLSSGERHLVLILAGCVLASRSRSILVIDEPELSLHVKWQRDLLQALLDCTRGAQTQIIVASHSSQMVGQHLRNVLQLSSADYMRRR